MSDQKYLKKRVTSFALFIVVWATAALCVKVAGIEGNWPYGVVGYLMFPIGKKIDQWVGI